MVSMPYQKFHREKIPIDKIVVPEERLRAYRDEAEESALKSTVKKFGIINEIGVKPLPDGRYELIYGEGRLRTLIEQGATEVEAKVWEVPDDLALELQIMENYARGRIDPKEFFKAIEKLYYEHGRSVEEIAELTGYSEERIKQLLRLRDLDPQTKLAFLEGAISMAQAEELLKIHEETERLKLLNLAIQGAMSAADIRSYRKHVIEGVCDRCGEVKPPLTYVGGLYLCQDCLREVYEEMGKHLGEATREFTCEFCGRSFEAGEITWPAICDDDAKLLRTVKEYIGLSLGIDWKDVRVEHWSEFLRFIRGG